MSLKASLDVWVNSLKAYDAEDFEGALEMFSRIADESKILVNMGLIYATLGEHEAAVEKFIEATSFDQYLAVAYFQCGVSNFLLANYDLALKDFEEALLYLRGNQAINYEQLGLKFRLFSAEVLFNKGLAQIYLGNAQEGLADMEEARRDKATDEHNVIDDAIADRGEGYTVFSIPVGVLYRPSEKKIKNLEAKDYMGKAKLVAAADSNDAFTTFTGVTRIKQGITPSGSYVESDGPIGLGRSKTEPSPAASPAPAPRATNLNRSQTTINVPSNARELTNPTPPREAPARSNTLSNRPAPGQGIGGPVRGLSVRKPNAAPPPAAQAPAPAPAPSPPAAPAKENAGNRMTEFYDSYLDSYAEEAPPPMPAPPANAAGERVAAWARSNANPNVPAPGRITKSAPSSYAPSSYGGGGSMRRRLTRRGTTSRVQSRYQEEEEGYVSGEYEDEMFELVRIRVKIHYADDLRGMAIPPDTPFEEFMDKVTSKFGKPINGLLLKFKDEDGGMVSLRDESDYDMAIETAREHAKGMSEGKLELWCTDA